MKFISKSVQETEKIAGSLVKKTKKGPNLIILTGPIGSGKTQLVKGIAKYLGIQENIQSPTFGMKKEYTGLVHYDLYMANKINSNEFISMLNEDLEKNIVIVEWGEKFSKKKLSDHYLIKVKTLENNSREYELIE